MNQKIDLLKNTSILSQLNDNELESFSKLCEFIEFKKNAVIFSEGEASRSFYIVNTGKVKIINNSAEKEENIIAYFLPGEIFGEFDLFENDSRSATAIADDDTGILVFPVRDLQFEEIYMDYPEIFVKIYHSLITINAGRIRQTNKLISEKNTWIEELKNQMLVDKLTGFYNRTYLEDELPKILKQNRDNISIAAIKPDNFKSVNDNFGHDAGDAALKEISGAVRSHLDENEIPVRFRGNEFLIIYLNTGLEDSIAKAKKLHSILNSVDIGKPIGDKSLSLTFSIGISGYPDHTDKMNDLVELAYSKLLEQRENGGNGILVVDKNEEEILNFLKSIKAFSSLSSSELKQVSKYLKPAAIKTDGILCKEGEDGDELFIIQSGRAAVAIKLQDGSEKEIAEFSTGDFFGEMAIFENEKRSATCFAKVDSRIFKLYKKDFLAIMTENPVIAIKIMREMLDITSARISNTGKFVSEMVKWGEEASRRAITDELTGLYNRRYLDTFLEDLFKKSKENKNPLSLIMADMDYFREVNEGYSHEVGDKYIVEVANIFKECLRETDVIARFGGDEFTIVLPETLPDKAMLLAENIRSSVEKLDFLDKYEGPALSLSVSMGIASYPDKCDDLDSLKEMADKALYMSKENGRNKVTVFS